VPDGRTGSGSGEVALFPLDEYRVRLAARLAASAGWRSASDGVEIPYMPRCSKVASTIARRLNRLFYWILACIGLNFAQQNKSHLA
jgi:hypothetical protein